MASVVFGEMTQPLISTLLQALPRHSEEGGLYYSVPRLALIEILSSKHSVEPSIAENTVLLCERLLETLSILDSDDLLRGEWRFISFPAQLLATSVLTALSDDESRLFAANFWNTKDTDNSIKDRQREVLRYIENSRNDHHAQRQASPIRYCYVAWSIIKLDGNILFYQREDTHKRHDKAAGDYGLIGGRANQNDLPLKDKAALLKELQSPHSKVIKDALPETLKRELREEAGLEFELHYTFKPWRTLKPYRQVQGAAPNHALTEYYLSIYQIDLTLTGYLFLQQKIKDDSRLVWFSLEDLDRGKTSDGKIPYIKALYQDFDGDTQQLTTALSTVSDSFSGGYLSQPTKYGLTLPVTAQGKILAGVLGKEKSVALNLSERQQALLLGLASHLRGFQLTPADEKIALHPNGWVQVASQSELQTELMNLVDCCDGTEIRFENYLDQYFRLSIFPEVVFLDERLFTFSVRQADLDSTHNKISVQIHRNGYETHPIPHNYQPSP